MNSTTASTIIQRIAVIIAIVFGLVTIFAGSMVWLGYMDPGYSIFMPLVIFNTIMGFIYIGAGLIIRKDLTKGIKASKAVFLINVIALLIILVLFILFKTVDNLALESMIAISFRTGVWLVIYTGLSWIQQT